MVADLLLPCTEGELARFLECGDLFLAHVADGRAEFFHHFAVTRAQFFIIGFDLFHNNARSIGNIIDLFHIHFIEYKRPYRLHLFSELFVRHRDHDLVQRLAHLDVHPAPQAQDHGG